MYLKRIVYCIRIHVIIIWSINAKHHDKSLRVIGGRDAAPGEFPYVMKMDLLLEEKQDDQKFFHLCTCSLLKSTWSLTAGHCIRTLLSVLSKVPSYKGVINYNVSFDHKGPYSKILSTVIHPNMYLSERVIRNDIGLLKSEKVDISSFVKLSSINYLSLYGNKVISLGYGVTKSISGVFDDAYSVKKPLQVLDIIITKCRPHVKVYPGLCSGGLCGSWSTVCPGDSGGPLLHYSGLVGINTAIDPWSCDQKIAPMFKLLASSGMHTPVSPYIDWIMKVIK